MSIYHTLGNVKLFLNPSFLHCHSFLRTLPFIPALITAYITGTGMSGFCHFTDVFLSLLFTAVIKLWLNPVEILNSIDHPLMMMSSFGSCSAHSSTPRSQCDHEKAVYRPRDTALLYLDPLSIRNCRHCIHQCDYS